MIKHVLGIKYHPQEVSISKGVLKFSKGVMKRFDIPNEHGGGFAVELNAYEDIVTSMDDKYTRV